MNKEKIKILDCKCHAVNCEGFILSNVRKGGWKKLSIHVGNHGYLTSKLHKRTVLIHRVVASAFIPNPFNFPEVHHRNDIRTDARAENLEWGDALGNIKDRETRKRTAIGSQVGGSKLTELQVYAIRGLRKENVLSTKLIAERYGISKSQVVKIASRRTWRHLK